ncbi:hypothetical protein SAMN04490183_2665 [Pseudomonas corrugata]|nr:hypothetical protein SAMN04490183_2665 [Pseudomonas corrugata]
MKTPTVNAPKTVANPKRSIALHLLQIIQTSNPDSFFSPAMTQSQVCS